MAATRPARKTTRRRASTDARPFRIDWLPPADLTPHPANYRQGDQGAIRGSLDRWGWYAPLVVQASTGRIVVGNNRFKAGLDRGDDLFPVVLRDLTDDEAEALLVTDNRTSDLALNDDDALSRLLASMAERNPQNLAGTGWDGDDVDGLLADVAAAAGAGGVAPSGSTAPDPPEPRRPKRPATKPGDVIELGPHRLLCGDSTDHPPVLDGLLGGERVAAVITDPPYAIYGSASGITSSIADDGMVRPMFLDILRLAQNATPEFAHVYVFCDWRSYPSWWEVAKRTGLVPKNLLVWDKGSSGMGNMWAMTHELVAFFVHQPPPTALSSGVRSGQRTVLRPNVLRHNRVAGAEREHNAAKPVAFLTDLITAATDPGGTILDPYAGSGSTLIAAEREGRVAYLVEQDPAMCDVIRARYAREVGRPDLDPGTTREPPAE